jgi:hypothetical protein
MPGKLLRYKVIHCKTCGKVIKRFDRTRFKNRHIPKEKILEAVRKHYKTKHPEKWNRIMSKFTRGKK